MSSTQPRLSFEESCRLLQRSGSLEEGAIPPVPSHRPQFDDEKPLGVSFFRTFVGEGDLENLLLPRTYFGRSQVGPISFKNTDFSESTLCWNDFTDVDFTDCDLSQSDLRASNFTRVKFVRTNLRDADLRQSTFQECDFTDADMRGAFVTRGQEKLVLSKQQRAEIVWMWTDGEVPPGG